MRKYIFAAILLLCFAIPSKAQFTTVTAQVKDVNGNLYQNCHGEADFVPSSSATTQPFLSGSLFQTSVVINQCDGNANMAVILADNNQVSDGHGGGPVSQWRFTICSSASPVQFSVCFNYTTTISGATQDLSAALKAASAPIPTQGLPPGTVGDIPKYGTLSSLTDSGVAITNIPLLSAANIFGATNSFPGLIDTGLTSGNCVQATTGGLLTTVSGACGTSSGTLTATGSPLSGYCSFFSGATSITGTASCTLDSTGKFIDSGNNAWSGANLFGNINKTCVVDGTRNTTIVAAITDCGTNSEIYIPKGTYTLAATLAPLAGQHLLCDYGATITQGSAANLNTLVTFDTNTANGASLVNCTLDGNWANQTFLNGSALLNIGSASNVLIQGNTFKNAANVGLNCVFSGSAGNPRIVDNLFTGVFANTALSCLSSGNYVGGSITHNRFVGGTNMGVHATGISVDHNTMLGYQAIQTVNTNGTGAVAFNSGTNFANVTPGMFIRINGSEYVITVVSSSIAITIKCGGADPACPATHTGYASIIGAADLMGIVDSSYVTVTGNTLFGGMGYGIVMGVAGSGAQNSNAITGNTVAHIGGDCINVYDTGAGGISNVAITGNSVVDCGLGGAANPSGDAEGIHLLGPSVSSVVVDGNSIVDDGTSTVGYCVYLSSTTSVVIGVNVCTNPVTGKVFSANLSEMTIGRVRSNQGTALTSSNWAFGGNWGTTPAFGVINAYDTGGYIQVTAGSGSPGANPTVTLTFADGLWTNAPNCTVTRADLSGPSTAWWEPATTTSTLVLTLVGTPNASQNYNAVFSCSDTK